ncbi:hypothetical protein Daura_34540 [Dactylosporangium aurantiacum]|uniref:Uncharacterized protein n=1 Tax=Dactylosporangium aurantiacum TaxID=35754 RepID=A0A9Q9IE83_9ACTN|nr:hypothetical protein [Dactylosporangium aurantiacum]MDG6107873.1 hypothetical protein [Dactylosporangium aurantiacum]UWZ51814.1 hypothetical protein Daura_34540 [Dactylosporangium aurantiacum]
MPAGAGRGERFAGEAGQDFVEGTAANSTATSRASPSRAPGWSPPPHRCGGP